MSLAELKQVIREIYPNDNAFFVIEFTLIFSKSIWYFSNQPNRPKLAHNVALAVKLQGKKGYFWVVQLTLNVIILSHYIKPVILLSNYELALNVAETSN